MKKLLAIALFATLIPLPVFADTMVAKSQDGSVVITLIEEPCQSPEVKEKLDAAGLESYKAIITNKGQIKAACWVPFMDEEMVGVLDEEGQGGMIPMGAFKVEASI